ncbi:MAG TPA: hypothetical protein VGL61_12795 [Kofleriaceae bacterium]
MASLASCIPTSNTQVFEAMGCAIDVEAARSRARMKNDAFVAQHSNGGVIRRTIHISVVVKTRVAIMMSSEIDIKIVFRRSNEHRADRAAALSLLMDGQ